MKIAYNPKDVTPLIGVSSDSKDIIFDLSGMAIYARGVKFSGTDTTYEVFKKHTDIDDTGGYSGLVPAPSYTNTIARFLREDGNWIALTGITPPDTELDIESTNSVENRVIAEEFEKVFALLILKAENVYKIINIGGINLVASGANDVLEFVQGDGILLLPSEINKSITISTRAIGLLGIDISYNSGQLIAKVADTYFNRWNEVFNWYKSVTDEDTDEHINKWNEIVDFLNGVTDTTLNGILTNFVNDLEVTGSGNAVTDVSKSNNKITVTKGNSFLPLSGGQINGALIINRDPSVIFFKRNGTTLGSIGFSGDLNPIIFNATSNTSYNIWHSGNDGSGSGLDADLLDGLESSYYFKGIYNASLNFNSFADESNDNNFYYVHSGLSQSNRPPFNYGGLLNLGINTMNAQIGIASQGVDGLYVRTRWWSSNGGTWRAWKQIAFTDSNVASATNARYVIADNNAKDPGHALLQSGSGRADASPSGDTWIYYDSLGGTSTPWGIKHEQASNLISFYGGGTRRAYIDLSNGNISCSTINGYTPITSGNIGSQSVNYASSAGNADKVDNCHASDFLQRLPWWTSGNGNNIDTVYNGTTFAYTNHKAPTNGVFVAFSGTHNSYLLQLQGLYNGENLYFRNKNGDNGTWNAWRAVLHSGNYTSYNTFTNLFVINDSSNSGYDALAYFQHRSNNDWTVRIDSGSYDYGLNITGAQTATYALSVTGGSRFTNTIRIGNGSATLDGNYCEGIRIRAADSTWATIILGATADTGTNTYAWSIHRTSGNNFSISRNSSDGGNGLLIDTSGRVGIGTTSPSERLSVNGWIGTIGNTGWYNITYAGGMYMSDSTWIRAYNNKKIYVANTDSTAFYTSGGMTALGHMYSASSPQSWLNGQKAETAALNIAASSDTGSYWPWFRQTLTAASKWISMGTLANSLYFIGSTTSRTANSYDYGFRMDFSNGYLYGNFSGYLSGSADKVDGYHIAVQSSAGTDASTIYFVT